MVGTHFWFYRKCTRNAATQLPVPWNDIRSPLPARYGVLVTLLQKHKDLLWFSQSYKLRVLS